MQECVVFDQKDLESTVKNNNKKKKKLTRDHLTDQAMYAKEINKIYTKDKKNLEAALASLYNRI